MTNAARVQAVTVQGQPAQEHNELAIWTEVERTDNQFTKAYDNGSFKGTSINAMWLVKQCTRVFGPAGKGWGYTIVDERFDEGEPLFMGNERIGTSKIHTLRLQFWYVLDGERYTVEHYGHTPFVFRTRNGIKTDPEASKKSLTDALKKCLSMLGFGADVWMGQYDDPEYVAELSQEFSEAKQAERAKEAEEKALSRHEQYIQELTEYRERMEAATTKKAIVTLYNGAVMLAQRNNRQNDILSIQKFKEELLEAMDAKRQAAAEAKTETTNQEQTA